MLKTPNKKKKQTPTKRGCELFSSEDEFNNIKSQIT